MAKLNKKQAILTNLKYYLQDFFRDYKFKILITFFILFIFLLTGIILAVRYQNSLSMNMLNDFGIVDFAGSGITTSFFSRMLSILLMMAMLFGCSYVKFLMPLAVLLLSFRTYLLGFNLTIMFLSYGFPGIIISFIVILPCQLAMLIALCGFYFLMRKCTCDCQQFGGCNANKDKLKLILWSFLLLLLICLLETLLLLIFNASVIIVI